MAVPVSPSIPTESSTAAPAGGFSSWFKGIGDWIKSLSPSGATEYDTNWTPITLAAGYQAYGAAPSVRRTGKDIEIRGMVQPNPAGNFTASANHRIALPGGVPSGFRPVAQTPVPTVGNTAVSTNGARLVINSDGSVDINTGPSTSPYYSMFSVRYKVD